MSSVLIFCWKKIHCYSFGPVEIRELEAQRRETERQHKYIEAERQRYENLKSKKIKFVESFYHRFCAKNWKNSVKSVKFSPFYEKQNEW